MGFSFCAGQIHNHLQLISFNLQLAITNNDGKEKIRNRATIALYRKNFGLVVRTNELIWAWFLIRKLDLGKKLLMTMIWLLLREMGYDIDNHTIPRVTRRMEKH
jgi:hypothetical protein